MAKKRESGLGRGLDALMGGGPSSLLEQSEGSGIPTSISGNVVVAMPTPPSPESSLTRTL